MRPRRPWLAALAISVCLIVPLVVFGGTALANGFAALAQYGHGPGSSQYQYGGGKVVICHATHSKKNPFVTIVVSAQGAANHLKHHSGDTRGACASSHSTTTTTTTTSHGKGKGNEKEKEHGSNAQSNQNHGNGKGGDDGDKDSGSGNNGNGKGKGH
jgi:hypothetical protein